MTIFQVYTPTSDNYVGKFYEFMDIHEINIVQGDWYAKVGPGYTTGQECLGNLAPGRPTRALDNFNLPEAITSPWQTPYTPHKLF